MTDYDAGVDKVIEMMKSDYITWSNDALKSNDDFVMNYEREDGRNYTKLIQVGRGGSRSVAGFIVLKDTKKFRKGDMLKSASWKSPATNFARGNVLDNLPKTVRWTGIS